MKKLAPLIAVVVLAGALAVLVYLATRGGKTPDPPVNEPPPQKNIDFKTEDFMVKFDLDSDGTVTPEEFRQVYGTGEPPLIFTKGDGKEPLDAPAAFRQWDHDGNGLINDADFKLINDRDWVLFRDAANSRGLKAARWKDKYLALNEHQLRVFETESAAMTLGTLPFAGTFWKPEYLGPWVSVVDPAEGDIEGYSSERNGRVYILTSKAELVVKVPARVQVNPFPPDDKHNLYVAEVARTPFDDPAANLALARKCREWGLSAEAGMLYARVLVFEPANQEALDQLRFKLVNERFVPKD